MVKFKRAKQTDTVGRWVVSLDPAQPAPLGHAYPTYYNVGSYWPDPAFWHVEPRAKMGGLAQWTPACGLGFLYLDDEGKQKMTRQGKENKQSMLAKFAPQMDFLADKEQMK